MVNEFGTIPPKWDRYDVQALLDHGLMKPCTSLLRKADDGYYEGIWGIGQNQAGKIVGGYRSTNPTDVLNAMFNYAPRPYNGLFIITTPINNLDVTCNLDTGQAGVGLPHPNSRMVLQGFGWDTVIQGTADPLFRIDSHYTEARYGQIVFRDLCFAGIGAKNNTIINSVPDAWNCVFDNLYFYDLPYGACIAACSDYALYHYIRAFEVRDGIISGGFNESRYSTCYIEATRLACMNIGASNLEISNCTFATYGTGGYALYADGGCNFFLTDSTFDARSAGIMPVAINPMMCTNPDDKNLTINNCHFMFPSGWPAGLWVGHDGDRLYRDVDASGTITAGDVRLTNMGGQTAGTTVSSTDVEIAVGSYGLTAIPSNIKHAENLTVNGLYDANAWNREFIYKDVDSSGTVTAGDIRYTRVATGGYWYEAGSTVIAGDADIGTTLVAFASNEKFVEDKYPPDGSFGWGMSTPFSITRIQDSFIGGYVALVLDSFNERMLPYERHPKLLLNNNLVGVWSWQGSGVPKLSDLRGNVEEDSNYPWNSYFDHDRSRLSVLSGKTTAPQANKTYKAHDYDYIMTIGPQTGGGVVLYDGDQKELGSLGTAGVARVCIPLGHKITFGNFSGAPSYIRCTPTDGRFNTY